MACRRNRLIELPGRAYAQSARTQTCSRLGYVPEEPYLYPYLTGREYLQLVGRMRCSRRS